MYARIEYPFLVRQGASLVPIKKAWDISQANDRFAQDGNLLVLEVLLGYGRVTLVMNAHDVVLAVGQRLDLRQDLVDLRVVGVDLSPDMLALAEKRVSAERLSHVEALLEMDAASLRFPDGSFDAAMAMFVITVVPDPDGVLAEMIRVVRPGGRVVLVNHFSVDRGLRAHVERWLSRFSARLGWRPNFPIERVLGRPQLRLVKRQPVKAFDLFTLLVFERM